MEHTKPKESNLFQSNLIVTIVSVAAMGLSFLSQIAVAYYFGTSFERDAYFAAISIPTVLLAIYIGSFGVNFIPRYSEIKFNKNSKSANEFLSKTLLWTGLGIFSITIIIVVLADDLLALTFSSIITNDGGLTKLLLIILLPTLLLQSIDQIFSYYLHIQGLFLMPSLSKIFPIVSSILIVILLNSKLGILSLAYGFLLGNMLSSLFLIYYIFRQTTYKFKLSFEDTSYDFIKVSAPLFLASLFTRSYPLIERSIASNQDNGSISYLGYANQLAVVLVLLTSSGLGTVLFPLMSKKWQSRDRYGLNVLVEKAIGYLLLISIPISLYVIFFGDKWITLLFERGAFNYDSSYNVWLSLSILTGFYISSSLGEIIGKSFYFSKKTKILAIIDFVTSIIYYFCAYTLGRKFGFVGLAISLSLAGVLHNLISLIYLRKIITNFKILNILKKIIVYVLVSGLTGFSIKIAIGDNLGSLSYPLITAASFFAIIFIVLKYFFRDILIMNLSSKFQELLILKNK